MQFPWKLHASCCTFFYVTLNEVYQDFFVNKQYIIGIWVIKVILKDLIIKDVKPQWYNGQTIKFIQS